jgi:hypothetical protein
MGKDQGMEEITKIHLAAAEGKSIPKTKTEMAIQKELEVKYCLMETLVHKLRLVLIYNAITTYPVHSKK